MQKNKVMSGKMNDSVSCFGEFDMARTLCRKNCGMRLRCALARLELQRLREMEEMEEIMDAYEITQSIQ
ncbi:MAG: hypothetical protein GXP53_10325 [Deltaproteobacteria bacterium]|nr:hypothetical protein [Deltaproteobacteria bacterium]